MSLLFSAPDPLQAQLLQLVAAEFRLSAGLVGGFTAEEPLIGGRLGLDSLDALALSLSVEKEFGLTIGSAAESRDAYACLASLAGFIRRQAAAHPASGPARWPLAVPA